MGYTCCVPGCRSGYKGEKKDPNVSLYKFPTNEVFKKLWIKAIPRDFQVTPSTKICSKHFDSSCIVWKSQDPERHTRCYSESSLLRKYLKEDAIPSIFPHPNSIKCSKRKSSTSSDVNPTDTLIIKQELPCELSIDTQENTIETHFNNESESSSDLSKSQEELLEKVNQINILPKDVKTFIQEDKLSFVGLSFKKTFQPHIAYSIVVEKDLSFHLFLKDVEIPASDFKHVTNKKIISGISMLTNLMNYLQQISERPFGTVYQVNKVVKELKTIIQDFDNSLSQSILTKLIFIKEQLDLSICSYNSRKYSTSLLITSFLLYKTSPDSYKQLLNDNFITLPSISIMQSVASPILLGIGLPQLTKNYLKSRVQSLNYYQRYVILTIDEVDCVEGNDLSKKYSKTLLCFMIKSLTGSHQDMIALFPEQNLDANLLHQYFMLTLSDLENIGYKVVAIRTNINSTNELFFSRLCKNKLQTSITHPINSKRRLFLLFDMVHSLNNLFKVFLERELFQCPMFEEKDCNCDLSDLTFIYKTECDQSIRMAHKLNAKLINLSPLNENFNLAESFIHESTINALQFHLREDNSTANFLKLIQKIWKIINVTSPSTIGDDLKTDISENPTITLRNFDSANFLMKFFDWLSKWNQNNENYSLDKQTHLALSQSCNCLNDLALYLLSEHNFDSILIGRFLSDPIEERFGMFRQINGSNYFTSIQQILKSDKIIDLNSLINFSNLTLTKIQTEIPVKIETINENNCKDWHQIFPSLRLNCDEPSDLSLIYYLSGFISHGIIEKTSCEKCQSFLSNGYFDLASIFDLPPNLSDDELKIKQNFLEMLIHENRLCCPSDSVYITSIYAWNFCNDLLNNFKSANSIMIETNHPPNTFLEIFSEKFSLDTIEHFYENYCDNGHYYLKFLKIIVRNIFNMKFYKYFNECANDTTTSNKKRRSLFIDMLPQKLSKN